VTLNGSGDAVSYDSEDDDARTLVDSSFPSAQPPPPYTLHGDQAPQSRFSDSEEDDSEDPEGFVRPVTPPQGSNHNPWTSYHDLRPSHPVFKYPNALRAKMYQKGIDPVVRAEMDKVRLGKVYGEKKGKAKSVRDVLSGRSLGGL
jgi:hypothetical protein